MSSEENPYAPGTSFVGGESIVGEDASAGRRLATFLIDVIAIRTLFFVGEIAYAVIHILMYGAEAYDMGAGSPSLWSWSFVSWYVSYYLVLEFFFGRTLGKALLGTKVVTQSGTAPTLVSLLIRTLSRLIPLEPLSFSLADTWWHDSLSKTKVLRVRRAS